MTSCGTVRAGARMPEGASAGASYTGASPPMSNRASCSATIGAFCRPSLILYSPRSISPSVISVMTDHEKTDSEVRER